VLRTGATFGSRPFVRRAAAAPSTADADTGRDARFWLSVGSAVAVGTVVRFTYLFHGAPALVHSDGFTYHHEALRIADGLGYTSPIGDLGEEWAHHAPGWVTLLSWVTEVGWRSMRSHQVVGLLIGLVLIITAGLVGRRYGGRRVGVVAALLAAVYPGFWVLEAQVLSEPVGLVVAGGLMLLLADLWAHPTLARAVLAGAVTGLLALVRSEQAALLVIAVAPILLLNPRLPARRRVAWTGAAAATTVVLIAPWTGYNLARFEEPVVLSTNVGFTLLAGNCPPTTYVGDRIGSYDMRCDVGLMLRDPDIDRSEHDVLARREALSNLRDNIARLPEVAAARYGRLLGVFRPSQTVAIAASWAGSATWPVWAWVTSFWLVAPLAAYGSVTLRRSRSFQWPLVAPLVIVVLAVTVAYGEPRYHTPADLGLLVLAAVAIDRLLCDMRVPGAAGASYRLAEARPVANLDSSDGATVHSARDELHSWGKAGT
jgi:4-amino-4-deoxy-L-arabinose transferase-like glycosyltransferase